MLLAAARIRRLPVLVIWAGSDVMRGKEGQTSYAQRSELVHIAVAPWLVDELKDAGISAQYIPIIGVRPYLGAELPKEHFGVFTYLPEPRRDFYGRSHVYEVARGLPDVTISVIGAGGPDPQAPPNIRFLGWMRDIKPIIDDSVVLLRATEHDGMSLVVLEALARGRYVAWKHEIPGVRCVATAKDTLSYLKRLRECHLAARLSLNTDGIKYISEAYEEHEVNAGLERFLNQVVAENAERRARPRRVIILGHDLFVTDVASLNNHMQTDWNAQVFQLDTKYAIASSLYLLAKSDLLYTVGTPQIGRFAKIISRMFRKPRVMHWVGTDIAIARHRSELVKALRDPSISHLTEVQWEVEELRNLDIHAEIVPLPPRLSPINSLPPLPSEFTLLTYLPVSRPDFYGSRELEAVIRAFGGRPIRFLIVGGGTVAAPPGSAVENLGWCYSLEEVYTRCSALLRFTPRDGLSLMVLEALALGRHVLWTKKFPFVKQVNTLEQTFCGIEELLSLHEAGSLRPQADASKFIMNSYNRAVCTRNIVLAWESATLSRSTPRTRALSATKAFDSPEMGSSGEVLVSSPPRQTAP